MDDAHRFAAMSTVLQLVRFQRGARRVLTTHVPLDAWTNEKQAKTARVTEAA